MSDGSEIDARKLPWQWLRRDGWQNTTVERQRRCLSPRTAASLAGRDEASPGAVLRVAAGVRRPLHLGVQVEQQPQTLRPRVDQITVQRQLEPVDSLSVRTHASTSQFVRRLDWRHLQTQCLVLLARHDTST